LEIEKEARDAEIDNQVHHAQQDYADGRITKSALDQVVAQAAILKAKNDQVTKLEAQAIAEQRDEQLRQETNAISEHEYQIRTDILQKQSSFAETAEERRKIELELLQLAYEQKRKVIQDIIDHSKDTVEIANARADLANLNANHALDQAGVLQQTRGPLENYLASLPTTAAKANEALQNLEVQGFDGLIDSVLALGDGMHSATESLLNTLKQFLLGLARLELQKALGGILSGSGGGILGSIGNLFGGSSGGLGPSLYPVSGGVDPLAALPGFASGGSGIFKGIPGVDRNVVAINGIPQFRVSHGERWSIGNDNAPGSAIGRGGDVYMTVNTPDADSFRRSQGQTTRCLKRSLA
jgi:phage-related minor tail protein